MTVRELAEQGTTLDVHSDRSCGGALLEHFWTSRPLPSGESKPPQQEALGEETRLVVGSLGGVVGVDRLDSRFATVAEELEALLDAIGSAAPEAEAVLVGYPRIVPDDFTKCQIPAPGLKYKPLADIPTDALPVLDDIQERLNDLMRAKADEAGAVFVDLYAVTGDNTACDGDERGIGGLFETSQIKLYGTPLPWLLHPDTRGRDIQAHHVATAIRQALGA